MEDKKFIFISGLHRSGTSLFYKILNEQENFSGLTNTNEIEDEGQFVQSVYLPAYKFGGVGKFGFNKESQLNETSILINEKNRQKLFKEWSRFWNSEFSIYKNMISQYSSDVPCFCLGVFLNIYNGGVCFWFCCALVFWCLRFLICGER